MLAYFFDTSALAKAYHSEIGSERVTSLIRDNRAIISSLAVVEFQSVFAQKVRTGKLAGVQLALIRGKLLTLRVDAANADKQPIGDAYSGNSFVDRYRSPRSGRMVTISLPRFSWRLATSTAAQAAAPQLMPHIRPSSLAKRRVVSMASSS